MIDGKTSSAFLCGIFATAFGYFVAMATTHGWCISQEFTSFAVGVSFWGLGMSVVMVRLFSLDPKLLAPQE